MKITIVIPMYNEGLGIKKTIRRLYDYLEEDYDVLIVDDGSKDQSRRIAEKYIYYLEAEHFQVIGYKKNKGKGHAVRYGLSRATGEWALMMDADLSTNLDSINDMINLSTYNDFIVGNRRMKGSVILTKQSLIRRVYSKGYNFLIRLMFGIRISDTQAGFKMYSKSAIRAIMKKSIINGFSFDIEHILICRESGLKVKELPIEWSDNKRQSFAIKNIIKMFDELMLIKGLYDYKYYRR